MHSSSLRRGSRAYQVGIVIMLLAALTIAALDKVNISVVGAYWVKHHMMTASKLGLIESILSWAITIFLLFAGPLVDRFHPRKLLPLGIGVWSVATWLTAVTLALPFLGTVRGLLGLGEATLLPSAPKLIVENVPKKHRSKAISVYFTGNKLGPFLGILMSSSVLIWLGWRAVFLFSGALGIIWMIIWFAFYRKDKGIVDPADSTTSRSSTVSWVKLLTYRNTWAMIIGQACYLYVLVVFLSWLPGIMVLQEHLSIGKGGALSSLPFIVGVVTTIFGGWLADAWVNKGVSRTVARKVIISGGLLLSTISVLIAAYSVSTTLTVVFLSLTMAFMGMVTGSVDSLPMDLAPREAVASVSSLQNFGGNLGASFAPLITGLIYTSFHNFKIALIITGAVALLGCFVYLFLLGKVGQTYKIDSEFETNSAGA